MKYVIKDEPEYAVKEKRSSNKNENEPCLTSELEYESNEIDYNKIIDEIMERLSKPIEVTFD
jgi:hypothetical protein